MNVMLYKKPAVSSFLINVCHTLDITEISEKPIKERM